MELLPRYSRFVAINKCSNLAVQIREGFFEGFGAVILNSGAELVAFSVSITLL